MREILFRGKRKDNGEWVEAASVLRAVDGAATEFYIAAKGGMDFIVDNDNNVHGIGIMERVAFYQVTPDTVGQYTGLTDKNGRKIFEGDACRFYGDEGYSDYVVFWDDTASQWAVRQIDFDAKDVLDIYFAECCEIIGNIHDNPKLLNQ